MKISSDVTIQTNLRSCIQRKRVGVGPERELEARRRLFNVLSDLYPVDFVPWSPGTSPACDGVILWDAAAEDLAAVSVHGLECLTVAGEGERSIPVNKGLVQFGRTEFLDTCFCGQMMVEEGISQFPELAPWKDDEVVCSLESHPYWLLRRAGRARISIVALGPDEMSERTTVYDLFNRRFWLRLLPFFQFLKGLTTGSDNWTPPPLRACIMFDDPNLHWGSYGFIDFAKLVRHAKAAKYHAAFAMVPLDSWLVHGGAAATFRENGDCLSLLMHGNDHTSGELGLPLNGEKSSRLLAQAIRRIASFEQRSGVSVARVMAPPHGAFREGFADAMLNLGYEAACVSRASLTSWNKEKVWPSSFGHSVAEFVGTGLPIIPRQVLARGHEGSYRLAAFLNQPIIPHGHHQDCAGGLDLVAHVVDAISSLGDVVWSDMRSISRSNYLTRQTGDVLFVRMLARRISLPVSNDVRQIVVERPWVTDEADIEFVVDQEKSRTSLVEQAGSRSPALILEKGSNVEIYSPPPKAIDPLVVKSPGFKPWTVTRRLLAEARDRMVPLATRVLSERKLVGSR